MNSTNHQDDPRLTAYALGELSASEREQVEALLREDESARQIVEEIRATAAVVASGFAGNASDVALTPEQRETIAASATRSQRSPRSRFITYVASGLAAAALVALATSVFLPSLNRARETSTYGRAQSQSTQPFQPPANVNTELPALKYDFEFLAGKLQEAQQRANGKTLNGAIDRTDNATTPSRDRLTLDGFSGDTLVARATKRGPEPSRGEPGFRLNNQVSGPSPFDGNDSLLIPEDGDAPVLHLRARRASLSHNTEAYDRITDNAFVDVAHNPLSTFSIDVDTASYSNVRRFINEQSQLPPRDAVRIEEMINYFPYEYPAPVGDAPFGANIEVAGCPWNSDHRLVRIALKGKEIAKENRPASNLVFLIDVSGSMSDQNKLPLLKSSMQRMVRELRESDRVAIVVYAGNSGLVLPSTVCDDAHQQTILHALENLQPGGSTNGAAGIQLAYQVASENFIKDGTNRVILCTDGDFNVGVTNQGDLTRLIEDKAKSNVFLSVLGFGMGNVKDSTMEKLADKGNGNYAYIDNEREANKVLVQQMSGTLVIIAKDVKIQVEFNPAMVGTYRLIGYENRMLAKEDFNDDKKDAGEIGAGHTVTALYEIAPIGAKGDAPPVDPLKYQEPTVSDRAAAVRRLKVAMENLRRIQESPAGTFTDAERADAQRSVDAEAKASEEIVLPPQRNTDELLTVKLRYKAPDAPLEQGTSKLLEFPVNDSAQPFANVSKDFKFASGVAAFGMVLRESPYKGNATLDGVIELAAEGRGDDANGYRGEFIGLVKKAKTLNRR